jgi:hypothetical protein
MRNSLASSMRSEQPACTAQYTTKVFANKQSDLEQGANAIAKVIVCSLTPRQ